MIVEQIYTGCLSHGAYYIESEGEVAIIDPLREVQPYIDMANQNNSKIKYVFETHFHADFVSGHVTLGKKTGADIVYGPNANPDFECVIAKDNQEFKLGNIRIRVLHTPGHTMESTSYLLIDENEKEHAVFTGDTLFLGDVGRPDLAQKAVSMTQEQLAEILFESLRTKIMTLPDATMVYPGHGAGSACGKKMSSETVGTIGSEKENNYALRADMTKEEFVAEVTDGLLPPPAYFPLNVLLNKKGYKDIDDVLKQGQLGYSPSNFEKIVNDSDAIVLDTRHQDEFAKSHIPGSIFIGIDGGFAPWVGALVKDVQQPILLVSEPDRIEEVITRLARVGFDNVLGYLEGGIAAWKANGNDVDNVVNIHASELSRRMIENKNLKVVDVRKQSEHENEHISAAISVPLSEINTMLSSFSKEEDNYIHCAGGYRSMIASSILKSRGVHNIVDVQEGFGSIKATRIPTSGIACVSRNN